MAGELYDALVIGAGAGGLCAAARLAHRGRHTLLIESRDRVGGRASTEEQGGIKVKFRIKRREVALQNTPLGRRRRDPGRGQVLGLQIAKAGDHAMACRTEYRLRRTPELRMAAKHMYLINNDRPLDTLSFVI